MFDISLRIVMDVEKGKEYQNYSLPNTKRISLMKDYDVSKEIQVSIFLGRKVLFFCETNGIFMYGYAKSSWIIL